jgi:hypothetical protein
VHQHDFGCADLLRRLHAIGQTIEHDESNEGTRASSQTRTSGVNSGMVGGSNSLGKRSGSPRTPATFCTKRPSAEKLGTRAASRYDEWLCRVARMVLYIHLTGLGVKRDAVRFATSHC